MTYRVQLATIKKIYFTESAKIYSYLKEVILRNTSYNYP